MSRDLPYFRWYPADAESDEKYSGMTLSERGLFHTAINYSWMNDGLPGEADRVQRVLRVPKAEFQKSWPAVSKCFVLVPSDPPRLRNQRQEEERSIALTKSETSSKAAKIRHERNASAMRPQDLRIDSALPRAYGYGSVSESVSEFKKPNPEGFEKTLPARVVVDQIKGKTLHPSKFGATVDELDAAWDRHLKYSRDEGKIGVFQVLFGMNGEFDVERFRTRHAAYCEAWNGRWQYCPLTFLAWVRAGMPNPDIPKSDKQKAEDDIWKEIA